MCDEKTACASAKNSVHVISMCMVPVVIKHKGSIKRIIIHAILDNVSQGTYIVKDLVNAFEIGIDTYAVVKTLNGKSRLKSKLVSGLAVSNTTDKKFWTNLPHWHTRKELPVDPEEILTSEKLRRWQHLQTIPSETVKNPSAHVDVLIEANCLPALEPTEFIRSEITGPYVCNAKLSWCIVGPIGQGDSGKETMTCNRIADKS